MGDSSKEEDFRRSLHVRDVSCGEFDTINIVKQQKMLETNHSSPDFQKSKDDQQRSSPLGNQSQDSITRGPEKMISLKKYDHLIA